MKWWHRWRARVWEMRYIMAVGKLAGFQDCDDPGYPDALAERMTAQGACMYHREKAGMSTPQRHEGGK